MELNDHCLWTNPRHFKYTLPSANMCIYLNKSAYPRYCCEESDWFRVQTSELGLHQFKNICLTTCAFVWRGRLRSTCVCHYLWKEWLFQLHAFIFLCRTNPWVKYPRNSIFFLIFKECYTDMKWKRIVLKIYF